MITFPSTNRDYVSEICGSNEFIQYQKQPPEVFYKKLFLKNSAIFTGKTCVGVSVLVKLTAFRPATLLKRDSNTCVFL